MLWITIRFRGSTVDNKYQRGHSKDAARASGIFVSFLLAPTLHIVGLLY